MKYSLSNKFTSLLLVGLSTVISPLAAHAQTIAKVEKIAVDVSNTANNVAFEDITLLIPFSEAF